MRFLLRPGWIALTVAVAGFAFGCYYLLAPWQFGRGEERSENNAALLRGVQEAPVARGELVDPGAEPGPDAAWRQVVVTGTYEPAGEVLVRLRSVEGSPASEVMTPLRTSTGEVVLVDRGYLRPPPGDAPPVVPPAPAGVVTVVGHQRPDETPTEREPIVGGGVDQVYSANAGQIGALTGVASSPGYVQLVADQPGVLTPVPLPPPDLNPSYSYAWQWLIFGLMAVGGWFYFVRLEYRTRRAQARGADPDGVRAAARSRRASDPRDTTPVRRGADPRDGAPLGPGPRSTAVTPAASRPSGAPWSGTPSSDTPSSGTSSSGTPSSDTSPSGTPSSAPQPSGTRSRTTSDVLADRYGR